MKWVLVTFAVIYSLVAALFGIAALALLAFAVKTLWLALGTAEPLTAAVRTGHVIESIGLMAVALVALEISQTVVEEEVVRKAQVSAPTRVRRYLSRFLVVIVVALSIENLVAVVTFLHTDPEGLKNASTIGFATAALLAA